VSAAPARVETPLGPFGLRPAAPGDEAFHAALFAAVQGAPLAAAGLPPALVRDLTAMQHRSREASYASAYPGARSLVVEHGGEAVGRLVLDEGPDAVRVVLLELRPDRQGRGLGRALMGALAVGWDGAGRAAALSVFAGNAAALALWQGLGFEAAGPELNGYLPMARSARGPGAGSR
jgi:ribosomal protein S18 acetylase RimI-like enzyme